METIRIITTPRCVPTPRLLLIVCLLAAFAVPSGNALVAIRSAPPPPSDLAIVKQLLAQGHISMDHDVQDIHRVTAKSAFCNALYRVTTTIDDDDDDDASHHQQHKKKKSYMAKVFSPLAAARMRCGSASSDSGMFRIDRLAAQHDLGPQIHAMDTDAPALLMQDCAGRVLTEDDLFVPPQNDNDQDVVQLAAKALAHLHSLSLSSSSQVAAWSRSSPNMLWQSCQVLLQQYANPQWKATTTCTSDTTGNSAWTYTRLVNCLQQHRDALEKQGNDKLLITPCGHGDCKPSNLLLLHGSNNDDNGERDDHGHARIRFLDLELAGTHYVAYDLAKLWRSSEPLSPTTRDRQRLFLETYAQHAGIHNVASLKQQVQQMLPLTWLEAAAFFVAMSSSSSRKNGSEQHLWDALALDRLRCYEECLSTCT